MVTAAVPGLAANQGLPPLVASEALRALLEAVKHGRMGSECVAHSISSEQETRFCNSKRRYQSCTCEVSHATALMVRRIRTRDGNVVDVVLTVEADVRSVSEQSEECLTSSSAVFIRARDHSSKTQSGPQSPAPTSKRTECGFEC